MKTEELQNKIRKELDLSKEVPDEELMEIIHHVLDGERTSEYVSLKEKSGLGKELFNSLRKLDVLQELMEDDEITEIMINGTDFIFIEKEGKLIRLNKRFSDRKRLEDVVQQIVGGVNRMVNEASPIVDARLEDGSRVNIVLYPIALNGPIVTIRKFSRDPMTMKDLIERQSLSIEISELLQKLILSKYNIFISGGTGSG